MMRRAGPEHIGDVLAVLDEAAAWLGEQGVRQWPPRFQREWIEPAVLAGDTWLAVDGRHVLATVTLDGADGLWADRPAPAAYVHRLAVRRTASDSAPGSSIGPRRLPPPKAGTSCGSTASRRTAGCATTTRRADFATAETLR